MVVFYSTARRARPSAATRGTTECSANTSISSSCGLLGFVHMGTVRYIWRQLCGTPDLLITYSRNSNFKLISFSDASYSTGNPEKAKSTSGSIHFMSGGSSTPALASSMATRGLCSYQGRAATAVEANTSRSGLWGSATRSWMRSPSSTTPRSRTI